MMQFKEWHSQELFDLVESEQQTYTTPGERAAYRAGMSTAFGACDYVAREIGARNKTTRGLSATAKLCGDMIEKLRAAVRVHDDATENERTSDVHRAVHTRRHKAPPGECRTCDNNRELNNEYHPSHDASHRCESGKRSHCSCDSCF